MSVHVLSLSLLFYINHSASKNFYFFSYKLINYEKMLRAIYRCISYKSSNKSFVGKNIIGREMLSKFEKILQAMANRRDARVPGDIGAPTGGAPVGPSSTHRSSDLAATSRSMHGRDREISLGRSRDIVLPQLFFQA